MKFGIDIDGVLANFTGAFNSIVNSIWPGRMPGNYVWEDWNCAKYITPDEMKQVWRIVKDTPYFWENLSSLSGVTELQQTLTVKDEVYFITSRGDTVGEPASVQSARWLHHRGLWPRAGYSTVLRVEHPHQKVDLLNTLGITFYLDDYSVTIDQVKDIYGMHEYLLDYPHNRAYKTDRVHSVSEYIEKIRHLDKR